MPRRILSRETASTETSMSSPIMMLWLVFRVRTNIAASGLAAHNAAAPPTTVALTRPLASPGPARDIHRHGPQAASLTAKPDSCLGPPGPHGRLDRAPARHPGLGAARVPPPPRARPRGRGRREISSCATRSRPRSRGDPATRRPPPRRRTRSRRRNPRRSRRARPARTARTARTARPSRRRRRRRRRGRRGGRRPARGRDAGDLRPRPDDGFGLWLDPAVADDPVYSEHWAGHRQVEVTIEPDRIVIRRA